MIRKPKDVSTKALIGVPTNVLNILIGTLKNVSSDLMISASDNLLNDVSIYISNDVSIDTWIDAYIDRLNDVSIDHGPRQCKIQNEIMIKSWIVPRRNVDIKRMT